MTPHDAEPVVTPLFTMFGSETTSTCEGDSCAIVVDPIEVADT